MNVDQETIQKLCTDGVFERGQTYRTDGRIRRVERFDHVVSAAVQRWNRYDVTIELGGTSIDARCT